MLMRLQKYSLDFIYKPGKKIHIADSQSRVFLKEQNDKLLDGELAVNFLSKQLPLSDEKVARVQKSHRRRCR